MTPWEVLLASPAARDLRRIDPTEARRIKETLLRFAETGHGDIARIVGSEQEWRLRVGT